MRHAFIIGFQYDKDDRLPGISIDLYQVYCFLKDKGWKDEEVTIFTDVQKDKATDVLKNAILNNIVDPGVLSFIEDSKERGNYINFTSHNHYNNFLSSLTKECPNMFIYYSGHSRNKEIILPNGALISMDNFRSLFNNCEKGICIMDCCQGGIDLPFELHENIYHLKENVDKSTFLKPKLICISSSLEGEQSISTQSGSLFTRHLFKNLDKDLQSLLEIMRKKNNSTVTISSSYPSLHYLFSFLNHHSNPISITVYPFYIICDLSNKIERLKIKMN